MAQLLVWFVILFYVPTLLFRFVASRQVDLVRRKIPNQIEDFFAAALPSAFLNIIAWLVLNTITLWKLAETSATLPLLLTSDGPSVLQRNLALILAYLITLGVIAGASGWIYGWVELRTTFLGADVARRLRGERWRIALWYHDRWATFFGHERVMIFPWLVQPTYVFVRTSDRLYHGRVEDYDRTSEGEIGGILLADAQRLDVREEALAKGTNFITPFSGSLWIRWSTITDINVADVGQPRTLESIKKAFEVKKAAMTAKRNVWQRLRATFARH